MSEQKDKCPNCKGTGMGQFYFNKIAPCDTCKGTGRKKLDRPDKEKAVEGLIDKYMKWLGGDEELFTMRMLLKEILALFPDKETQ